MSTSKDELKEALDIATHIVTYTHPRSPAIELKLSCVLLGLQRSLEWARHEALKEAIQAVGFSARKHVGADYFSQGMDAGATAQVNASLRALRDLLGASEDGKAPAPQASAEGEARSEPNPPRRTA